MKIEQYENAVLYCGDCREIFGDLPTVQAAVTAPPHVIRYETRHRKFMERPGSIENDESVPLWCVPLIAGKVKDGGVAGGNDSGGTKDENADCMGQEKPHDGRPCGRLRKPN